jgi:tetratricopeptide (TPR) repeat protein
MGVTALAAIAVGGPLAAATVAVGGRIFGSALGESGKKLLERFVERASDYFLDTTAEPLIDGFRKSHPTLEDIYREAFRLCLLSIHPPAGRQSDADAMRLNLNAPNRAGRKYDDWFENWNAALKVGVMFDSKGLRLPETDAQALASFRTAMERLDGQGTLALTKKNSTVLTVREVPEELLEELTARIPELLDQFFCDLLVKPENETALKESQLAFQDTSLISFEQIKKHLGEIKGMVSAVAHDSTAIRVEQANLARRQGADSEKLDAIYKMLERRFESARDAGVLPNEALNAKDTEIKRLRRELQELQQQISTRSNEPAEFELSKALAARDLDAALRIKSQQVDHSSVDAARDLYELGTIHEFRFEWPQALEAYRAAWKLGKKQGHGLRYAVLAQKLNHFTEAVAAFEALLPIHTKQNHRANTLSDLGTLYYSTQRVTEAEKAWDEALAIYRDLAKVDPATYLLNVAATLNNLAILLQSTQRITEAEDAWNEALARSRDLAKLEPDANLPNATDILSNLAALYYSTQRVTEAEKAWDEALANYRNLATANPDEYMPGVARTLDNLGILYRYTQRFTEAEKAYDEALASYRNLAESNPDAYLPYVSATLGYLGLLYADTQRISEAERAYSESIEILRSLARSNPDVYLPRIADTLNNMGLLYSESGRMGDAKRAYGEALTNYRKLVKANPAIYHPGLATTLNNLGLLNADSQEMGEAEKAYAEALNLRRDLAEANPDVHRPGVAQTLHNLGILFRNTQRIAQAEKAYIEALDVRRNLARANPDTHLPDLAATLDSLAILYSSTQRMPEAEKTWGESLDISRKLAEANPAAYVPKVARTLYNLSLFQFSSGRNQDAEIQAAEAERILCPFWKRNPAVNGDLMSYILWTRALISEANHKPMTESCTIAVRALAAAQDQVLKQQIQELVDHLRPEA